MFSSSRTASPSRFDASLAAIRILFDLSKLGCVGADLADVFPGELCIDPFAEPPTIIGDAPPEYIGTLSHQGSV